MYDILNKIVTYKKEEISFAKKGCSQHELQYMARSSPVTRGFTQALKKRLDIGSYALIAEIKKASPSRGLIRNQFNPSTLAEAYEAGGATCLSILTDTPSFQGAPEHLAQARNAVLLPVLRKDFIVDPYQILEARVWGADCILLIMAALEDTQAQDLCAFAKLWQMDVLIEVHDANELERAFNLDSPLIGINNRDLKTFYTSLDVTENLAPQVPKDKILISESGIYTYDDLNRLAEVGAHCFLVGESLMRQDNVEDATRKLLYGDE
ncbi:MAG: indole-3-glycerol phosphate synthase TrpC [Pseudomonadota bacterium]